MKTIINEVLAQLLCIVDFNAILCTENLNKVSLKNIEVHFSIIDGDKTIIKLDRNLKHLELVNHLEGFNFGENTKYFSPLFLSEMQNSKYQAQMNVIDWSRYIIKQAG